MYIYIYINVYIYTTEDLVWMQAMSALFFHWDVNAWVHWGVHAWVYIYVYIRQHVYPHIRQHVYPKLTDVYRTPSVPTQTYLTESVCKVVLQKSIFAQIRQLILHFSNDTESVLELTFARQLYKYLLRDKMCTAHPACQLKSSLISQNVFIDEFPKVNSPTKLSTNWLLLLIQILI